ncbi:MAG: SIMPL domain-containing protein [Candidatus Paceibacterota bacterium]
MENTKNNSISSIIIGISIIVCTIIFSVVFYSSRYSSDSLTVTGSASMQVVSDNAKFTGEFTRIAKVSVLGTGYSQIANDLTKVKAFLKTQGIDDKDITISTVSMYENYNYDKNYQTEKEYILRQQVEISSKDIDKITSLAQSAQQLINQGVIFSVNPVEYYYSKLPDVRVNLLSDAIKDAMARANKMAESTGKKVGNLKSASSGVVQVLPSNSLEISDYGTYDTSKINKNIMVTVKASFGMK